MNYDEICRNIAADIAALKDRFPQLTEFTPSVANQKSNCSIDYEYHCRQPAGRAGWAGAAPNPDPDGVWFYIGLWDESDPSQAESQINSQPAIPRRHIGNRRVTFLILEGGRTASVNEAILAILKKHGLRAGR